MTGQEQASSRFRRLALALLSPLVLLCAWEVAARTGVIDARFFPMPSRVAGAMARLTADGSLPLDILASLRRIAAGLALAFIPGVMVGLLMGLKGWARAAFGPLVALTYPIPKIALLPLLLIIFGLGEMSNIMVVAIGVFFLALINTYDGARQISSIHFDVARVYQVGRLQLLLRIVLPATFPAIFTGLKLSVGYGLILIVAAEMVAAESGLGFRIWTCWETFAILDLYVYLATISIIGIIISTGLEALEARLVHWKGT